MDTVAKLSNGKLYENGAIEDIGAKPSNGMVDEKGALS